MERDMEAFLKNAKENKRGYDEDMLMLALKTEKTGKYPCNKCKKRSSMNCQEKVCIAWYCWFKTHWRAIRRAGRK